MRVRSSLLSVPFVLFLMLCITRVLENRNNKNLSQTTPPTFQTGYFSKPPIKRTTKSLAELGAMDELNPHILFFNRIPKSGSEMLLLLLQWLQGWNNFRHVRLKDENKPKMSTMEQEELLDAIQSRIKQETIPLCFDQPIHFINFSSYDKQSPTYINLVRDPVDNFIARYQFKKTTASPLDRYLSATVENKVPIEKCIKDQRLECIFEDNRPQDFSIPYFCGQDDRCMLHNNRWALSQAKSNVDRYYHVVGVLEEVNTTLAVFETKLPYFFKGVLRMYYKDLLEPYHIDDRKTKLKVTRFARKYLKNQLKTEYEFYEWIKKRLFRQFSVT
ncbi:heparan sulfate 2-o-sulfotransferase [Holotrichia oblita]|uniref:Heparan sulfate 2-o-sulfotransferase n=1 Tax=Holotrichia oblita TaxID=644536 RepID=A0ACB9T2M5_HOLOL|nr:heparan sulfate 2-o-sulfotransferase [Holotrichia oblita]